MGRFTEEESMIGRNGIDEVGKFLFARRAFQELAIFGDGGKFGGAQALAEASGDEFPFVRTKLDATVIVNQGADEIELTVFHEWWSLSIGPGYRE